MKILIAYATKTGSTQRCAERLAAFLSPRECVLTDLSENTPDIGKFDVAVLGAPVRFGKIHKSFKKFVTIHTDELMSKKCGFFVCCANHDSAEKYMRKAVGDTLLGSAFAFEYFGGEMKSEYQNGLFDRIFVRMYRNKAMESQDPDYSGDVIILPELLPETISRFADEIKKL